MRRAVRQTAALIWLVLASVPGSATALDLSGLVSLSNGQQSTDNVGYEALTADIGRMIRPGSFRQPQTLGAQGWRLSYDIALAGVDDTPGGWTAIGVAMPDSAAVSRLAIRKGLPASFELGVAANFLHELELWALGAELKWALVDGLRDVPDIGMRLFGSTLLGARDATFVSVGAELVIGYKVVLGGVVQLTPYAGYGLGATWAGSRTLPVVQPEATQATVVVPDSQATVRHQALAGVVVGVGQLELAAEFVLGDSVTTAISASARF